MTFDSEKHRAALTLINRETTALNHTFVTILFIKNDPTGKNGIYFTVETESKRSEGMTTFSYIPLPTVMREDKILTINCDRLQGVGGNIYIHSQAVQTLYEELQVRFSKVSSNTGIIIKL